MPRLPLSLCLLLVATSALANEPVAGEEPTAKAGKSAVAVTGGSEGDSAISNHPAIAPARSSTPRTPRWHSLLPGMIR